jgi:glycosyltransferase involved in cell wall biosynthesis
MHVLITANTAWNLVNFRRGLIAAFLADGHRVTVLAPPDAQSPVLETMGCRVIALQMDRKGLSPLRDLGLLARLTRHFRRERPDVVLSYTIKNNIFGAFAARRLGIAFLPNVTGLGTAFLSGSWLQRLVEALYRRAFRAAPVVFFQNPDDHDLFVARGLVRPGQGVLLPGSGIDLAHFAPAPMPPHPEAATEGLTFLLIARLLRDKGVVEFTEAARQLRQSHPGLRFQLLGALDAGNRSAIPATVVEGWQEAGILTHLGHLEDVRPAIMAADCVVLPSYREGMPRALLEAAAMARPVIATDVPGCRDAVEDGVTGFLCPARDAQALRLACLKIAALSPEDRTAMGRQGRARVARLHDQGLVIAAYRTALAQVAVDLAKAGKATGDKATGSSGTK